MTGKHPTKEDGNLTNNYPNQLREALGRYEIVYVGGAEGGTVRSLADGRCYDWWPTNESFRRIRIMPAASEVARPEPVKDTVDREIFVALLESAKAAYQHLDTYGVVSGEGTEKERESQERVFDLLRSAIESASNLIAV